MFRTDSLAFSDCTIFCCLGIAELVFSAIQSADIDMRNELYKHIGENLSNSYI